jgi:uncharacterized protein (UPF0333 family)
MGKILKENWFRGGILLLVLVMACSISYYYLIFIPQQDRSILQQAQLAATIQAQAAAAKEQQLTQCLNNANQNFVDNVNAECKLLGYTQTQASNSQCFVPINAEQNIVSEQSNAEALCATLYK